MLARKGERVNGCSFLRYAVSAHYPAISNTMVFVVEINEDHIVGRGS